MRRFQAKRFFIFFICIFILSANMKGFTAQAADWYVDKNAVGQNDGTSWLNSWESFADITWGNGGVVAGDTLYISGGLSGTAYTESLRVQASGSSGSPITIKTGAQAPSPSGHDGMVTIDASGHDWGIIMTAKSHITIDGEDGAGNINLKTANATNGGIRAYKTTGGIVIRYVEAIGNEWGFYIDPSTACYSDSDPYSSVILEYCYTHNNVQDGITCPRCTTGRYNRISADHGSHMDGWECYGGSKSGYLKIYGNSFEGSGANSQFWGAPDDTQGPFYIYNNTFQSNDQIENYLGADVERAIRFKPHAGSGYELYIWNNTFAYTPFDGAIRLGGNEGTFDVIDIRNNLFYNSGLSGQPVIYIDSTVGTLTPTINYNIIYSDDASYPSTSINVKGTIYSCSDGSYSTYNTDGNCKSVIFANSPSEGTVGDLSLDVSDTNAVGAGVDLSSYFKEDINRKSRSEAWDIGAFQLYKIEAPLNLHVVK